MVAGLLVFAVWSSLAPLAVDVPQISRPVTDAADVLSPAEEEAIARELVKHREATGVQLAVLLVATTEGEDIADFAQRTFTAWGGGSAERNDGALFVLAIEDRRSRLHLGYGLEPLIPDASAKRMLDGLRPRLRAKDYAGATLELVHAVRARTSHLTPGGPVSLPFGSHRWLWLVIFTLGIAAGVAWGIVFERGLRAYAARRVFAARPSKGSRKRSWLARAGLAIIFLVRQRPVQLVLGVLLALQLAFAMIFRAGDGFVGLHSFIFWSFWVLGWLIGGTPKTVSVTVAVLTGLLFAFGLGMTLLGGQTLGPFADGAAALAELGPALGIFWGLGAVVTVGIAGGASGGGSGSYSSGSSSYSSSSYSSSSSSYSSSSYSGGGGSSGGGGASSSW